MQSYTSYRHRKRVQ